MKELSIEEKAKRYDEVLARATGANLPYYTEDIMTKVREFVEYLLPELKESEGESIRKRLIELLKNNDEQHYAKEIAWLEKQGLTPIFRIGDTIIAKDGTYIEKEPFHIDMIEDDCYWDGENTILVCNQDEFEIFKQKPAEWNEDDQSNFNELGSFIVETYRAEDASKLFIWFKSLKDRVQLQPKQEWSEKDDAKLKSILFHIEDVENKDVIDWLKSLKDRFIWKPSALQMEALESATENCAYSEYQDKRVDRTIKETK